MEFLNDEYFMRQALRQAEKAAELGEVPVGAVAVLFNHIAGTAERRHRPCGDACDNPGGQPYWRLAIGQSGNICHQRTLRHVRRSDGQCPFKAGGICAARPQIRSLRVGLERYGAPRCIVACGECRWDSGE